MRRAGRTRSVTVGRLNPLLAILGLLGFVAADLLRFLPLALAGLPLGLLLVLVPVRFWRARRGQLEYGLLRGPLRGGLRSYLVSVEHLEPIGWWHFAHSFVRGNWRREDESSYMLLAKCVHDIDWLNHVIGLPARRVSSFGRELLIRVESCHDERNPMSEIRRAKTRGHEIAAWMEDGEPAVTVDGTDVPVRVVEGEYAVAYLEPHADLLEAARHYARLLD
jgi:hypothetical protein